MTRPLIVKGVERASSETIAGLAGLGVATVYEAQGKRGLFPAEIAPIQQGTRIAGSAITVISSPGDNLMVHAAVEVVAEGDVLVVALTEPGLHGMVGDLLATSLRAHGCIALVIDSAVRDSAELREMGFPVWSRAVYSAGTTKATAGSVNLPIALGEAQINPGDVIVADEDGVVVVAREEAPDVLEAGTARLERESATRARLEAGELGVDFYDLRSTLDELGVQYVDDPAQIEG
jgi:4-hydroxy-4-methyl-2-oxoglutarate aldolase